jgi:hypothetical protein
VSEKDFLTKIYRYWPSFLQIFGEGMDNSGNHHASTSKTNKIIIIIIIIKMWQYSQTEMS